MRTALVAAACLATVSAEVRAQGTPELSVQLIAAPGVRLSGALIALMDSADVAVYEVLSNSTGQATVRAAPGRYRIRVRRIGYRPFFSEPVTLSFSGRMELRVESPRVVLEAVVVNARAQCGRIVKDANALATAWEEIAKALRASELTSTDVAAIGRSTTYKRDVASGGTVISADTSWVPTPGGRPFAAIDHGSLLKEGYVRGNPATGWEYFGPDQAVILSSGFAETHCFRLVRDARRKGEIGVAFEPVPRRRISDIKGVLWIDATTSELREVVFRYVNVDILEPFEPGGFARFRRMPSGAWIVSEWQLKMPKLVMRPGRWSSIETNGYIENGGHVATTGERRSP